MSQQESDEQRANLVRTEQADQTVAIEGKDAAFALDRPEAIPKLHVPGLSPDATSVPPEALRGEVPTLTESVSPEAMATPEPVATAPEPAPAPVTAPVAEVVPEPAPEPVPESVPEPVPEPVAEPVAETVTAPVEPPQAKPDVVAQAPEPTIHNVEDVEVMASPADMAPLPTVVPELQEGEVSEEASAEPLPDEAESEEVLAEAVLVEEEAQELTPEADTWAMQMQVRIEKLTDEISSLNDRLDRFEKLPKV